MVYNTLPLGKVKTDVGEKPSFLKRSLAVKGLTPCKHITWGQESIFSERSK